MGSSTDSLWLIGLFSKYNHVSILTIVATFAVLAIVWLTMSLIYWALPGGPAWGKYRLTHLSCLFNTKPIPGPKGLPIIGSLGLMSGLAHRKIAQAAERFSAKRLMAFSMGETRVVVSCHPEPAKELLNSPSFVNRPIKESAYSLMFNRAIGFAPYGVYWRTLRRVAANHLFSPKQIKAYETQRMDIAQEMSDLIGAQNKPVQVRDVLRSASLSNMMGSVFGRKYCLKGEAKCEVVELRKMVAEGYDLLGLVNWADHLSWLSEFDLQKIKLRCAKLVPNVNDYVGRILDEHKSSPAQNGVQRDFVDVLLSLQGSDKLSDSDMIAVLWEMIFRGTDTVAVLIEWVLARLVLHPDIQSKVHDELDNVVGRSRAVTESDVTSLNYLTAVIKEVLRMHPPGPLLSWARMSIEDTTIDGHHIPAGTTAMVDMWAIARDPEVWIEPNSFNPDRFLTPEEQDFSVLGSDLRLAPFGAGRRSCPGKSLGMSTVTFWLASLLHEFVWKSPCNVNVDLSEELKLSCEMANPLKVEVERRRVVY